MQQSNKLWIMALIISLAAGCGGRKDKAEAEAADEAAASGEVVDSGDGEDASPDGGGAAESVADKAKPPMTPSTKQAVSSAGSNDGYVLNELNFEIKKLGAEVKHLASELRDLQGKSSIWTNPLTIYSKEIILNNGSTFFGKIVYQDEKILKVETLIGYLIVERSDVVRIIENIPVEPISGGSTSSTTGDAGSFDAGPAAANRVVEPSFNTGNSSSAANARGRKSLPPNIVLVGTIEETKDKSGNLRLSGKVKNIGGRRADFVKINFVFRKDWSGNTKTLTTFAGGSFHTFDSGITSESSVLPGAMAEVVQFVPKSFGTFIGYSYTIDWEDY